MEYLLWNALQYRIAKNGKAGWTPLLQPNALESAGLSDIYWRIGDPDNCGSSGYQNLNRDTLFSTNPYRLDSAAREFFDWEKVRRSSCVNGKLIKCKTSWRVSGINAANALQTRIGHLSWTWLFSQFEISMSNVKWMTLCMPEKPWLCLVRPSVSTADGKRGSFVPICKTPFTSIAVASTEGA